MKLSHVAGLLALFASPAQPRGWQDVSAQAFVERLYKFHDSDQAWPNGEAIYTPALAALMKRDAAIAARYNEVNILDYGVLCSCQDSAGMRTSVSTLSASTKEATIAVQLAFGAETRSLTLKLVRSTVGWRIGDIVTPEGGSLLATLRRGLAQTH